MKLRHGSGPEWKDATPHRALFKAGVLVDDLVHKGVSEASGELESRGWDKRKQAYLATTAGLIAGTFLYYKEPELGRATIISMQNFAALFASVAVFEPLSKRQAGSDGAAAESRHDLLAKIIRLPILIASASALVYGKFAEMASIPLASGFVWGAYAIGLYIMSSSTGMVDRIKEWAADLLGRGHAMAPVPIKIKD